MSAEVDLLPSMVTSVKMFSRASSLFFYFVFVVVVGGGGDDSGVCVILIDHFT